MNYSNFVYVEDLNLYVDVLNGVFVPNDANNLDYQKIVNTAPKAHKTILDVQVDSVPLVALPTQEAV